MRTTVTLEPDVERDVREACHNRRLSFNKVLNEALREALKPPVTKTPSLLPPKSMGFQAGIDPRRLNQLADELEVEAFMEFETNPCLANKPRHAPLPDAHPPASPVFDRFFDSAAAGGSA